jgi:hypothetical protein
MSHPKHLCNIKYVEATIVSARFGAQRKLVRKVSYSYILGGLAKRLEDY